MLERVISDLFSADAPGLDLFCLTPAAAAARYPLDDEEAGDTPQQLLGEGAAAAVPDGGSFVPNPRYSPANAIPGMLPAMPVARRGTAAPPADSPAAAVAVTIPAAPSPAALTLTPSMYEFVGKFMGVSVRTKVRVLYTAPAVECLHVPAAPF